MPKKIYFISGLGADKRVFRKLAFPADLECIYLDWLNPNANESLADYAKRLSSEIDTAEPFILVGLSFGGMLATEIAKILQPEQTFIISSLTSYKEIPWYFRFAGKLRVHQAVSIDLAKRSGSLAHRLFGLKKQDEKAMLNQIIADTDPVFLKWALGCILNWENTIKPPNLTHIHGETDKILPLKYTRPDIIINKGGHLMVYTHAKQIADLIISIINCIAELTDRG